MEETKEYSFEVKPKPVIEGIKEILAETSEFSEPEKAQAIIKHLSLQVGTNIKENNQYFEINPRVVLEGSSPEHYKDTMINLKKILTKQEVKAISKAISANTKSYNEELYKRIEKRTDKFYFRGQIKKSLDKELTKALTFFKENNHTGLNNTIYHLLSKEKKDYIHCYKCAWGNKPIPDIRKWNEKNDGEYIVLTDSEADERADESIDEYLWREAVQAKTTEESFEDWKETVLSTDGRGSMLNHYDGSEESIDINCTTYYIYRTN